MRKFILLLSLGVPLPCRAVIGASGTAAVCTAFNAISGDVTRTEAANNTVVVVVAIRTTTSTVSTVNDSGSSGYAFRQAINNGTAARVEIWSTTAGGSKASTTVTITLGATSKFVGCVFEYTGVLSLGVAGSSTSGANPSISLTTQDSNNWCVGGFAGQGTNTFTAGPTATLRASAVTSGGAASSNEGGAFVDTGPIASPGSCVSDVTNADTVFANADFELRSVAPPAGCSSPSLTLLGVECK